MSEKNNRESEGPTPDQENPPPPPPPVESPGEYYEFGEDLSDTQTINLSERKGRNSSTRKDN